jgi:hypothetical protein
MVAAWAVLACALGGCGQSTSQQVQAKMQQFATAVRSADASTMCDQVLAPALLTHFTDIGLPCVKAMRDFFTSVHDPTLAVGRIVVTGKKAEAITLSGAKGQIGSLSAIELVNTSNGWRVSGLGSPLLPGDEQKKATTQTQTATTQTQTATTQTQTATSRTNTATSRTKKPKK